MSKTDTADGDDAQTETETFNAFGRHGRIVEDPDYLVWLEEADEKHQKYGTHRPAFTPREAGEWLYMAVKGIPYGEVRSRVNSEAPTIVLEKRGEYTKRYNAATGEEMSGG